MAWLFNIRGQDVGFNPVVLSFALISQDDVKLYIDSKKLNDRDLPTLSEQKIELYNYDELAKDLQQLPTNSSILIDPKRNCYFMYKQVANGVKKILATNPSTYLKAIKNEVEISNTRTIPIRHHRYYACIANGQQYGGRKHRLHFGAEINDRRI